MTFFGLICFFDDHNKIRYKFGNKEAFCIDAETCRILKFWKCTSNSTIMVPCLVEQNEMDHSSRLVLLSEMIDLFVEETRDQKAKIIEIPVEDVKNEEKASVTTNETTSDPPGSDFARRHEIMFNEIKTLSSCPQVLHKEDYPFVITAFAAEGLKQTPPDSVLYFSRRIGLFHVKKNDIIGCEGGVEQYVKGIVSSPTKFSYLNGIPQPEAAKSVKIVKTSEIIFKGCALLGYIHHPADAEKPDKWIGWNDYTGLLSFDHACTRLLKQKHRDFDSRCGFVMFSASLTRTGKWKVKEISYSRQEIVENESQMPLDICFIDDLSLANQSHTDIKLISDKMTMYGGKQLVVSCKREHFDSSMVDQKIKYGAIIVPFYSQDGVKVQFEALAVLPIVRWNPETQFHRLASILPTWDAYLPTVPETSFFLDVQMNKGYL